MSKQIKSNENKIKLTLSQDYIESLLLSGDPEGVFSDREFTTHLIETIKKEGIDLKTYIKILVKEVVCSGIEELIGREPELVKGKRGGSRDHSKQESWTYLATFMASQPMLHVNETGYIDDDSENSDFGIMIPSPPIAEDYTIRQQLQEKLSPEAKYILQKLYEEDNAIITTSGKITLTSITTYMKNKNWNKMLIDNTLKEIKSYLMNFTYINKDEGNVFYKKEEVVDVTLMARGDKHEEVFYM